MNALTEEQLKQMAEELKKLDSGMIKSDAAMALKTIGLARAVANILEWKPIVTHGDGTTTEPFGTL